MVQDVEDIVVDLVVEFFEDCELVLHLLHIVPLEVCLHCLVAQLDQDVMEVHLLHFFERWDPKFSDVDVAFFAVIGNMLFLDY